MALVSGVHFDKWTYMYIGGCCMLAQFQRCGRQMLFLHPELNRVLVASKRTARWYQTPQSHWMCPTEPPADECRQWVLATVPRFRSGWLKGHSWCASAHAVSDARQCGDLCLRTVCRQKTGSSLFRRSWSMFRPEQCEHGEQERPEDRILRNARCHRRRDEATTANILSVAG